MKKLRLQRETLRQLNKLRLRKVNAGAVGFNTNACTPLILTIPVDECFVVTPQVTLDCP